LGEILNRLGWATTSFSCLFPPLGRRLEDLAPIGLDGTDIATGSCPTADARIHVVANTTTTAARSDGHVAAGVTFVVDSCSGVLGFPCRKVGAPTVYVERR
jgi:hypothetical protein